MYCRFFRRQVKQQKKCFYSLECSEEERSEKESKMSWKNGECRLEIVFKCKGVSLIISAPPFSIFNLCSMKFPIFSLLSAPHWFSNCFIQHAIQIGSERKGNFRIFFILLCLALFHLHFPLDFFQTIFSRSFFHLSVAEITLCVPPLRVQLLSKSLVRYLRGAQKEKLFLCSNTNTISEKHTHAQQNTIAWTNNDVDNSENNSDNDVMMIMNLHLFYHFTVIDYFFFFVFTSN